MMNTSLPILRFQLLMVILIMFTLPPHAVSADPAPVQYTIPVERVADYIYSVIESDRMIYTSQIVERMTQEGIVTADEHWELQHAIPLPAQFLQAAGKLVAKKGHGIRYRLVSLWPIYERNGPATPFEREGLKKLQENSDQSYSGIVHSGDMTFFQAIYPDKAVVQSCITCHNAHPLSPKRDFKLGETMGGIVITIPLDQE